MLAVALLAFAGVVAGGALADTTPADDGAPALGSDAAQSSGITINETQRTVAETTVGPGESTTVEVVVKTEGQLQTDQLFEIHDQFSPAFGDVTLVNEDPGGNVGTSNNSADAFWSVTNETYTLTYEVTVPSDAQEGDTYDISGSVEVFNGGISQSLPSETITVGQSIPDETTIELQPSDKEVKPNGQTTYDVVVTGADDGVGSYSVNLTSSDTTVGEFTNIDLAKSPSTDNSVVTSDGSTAVIDADLGSNTHAAAAEVTIATVTVQGNQEGTSSLSVDSSASVSGSSGSSYTIDSRSGASLTVAKPEATVELQPQTGGAQPNGQTEFDVVVTGATEGVSAYTVNVSTNDTTIGEFTDVELANSASSDNSQVASDGSWARVEADLGANAHSGASAVTIATLNVSTGEKGTAALSIASGASVTDSTGVSYDVTSLSDATLIVSDAVFAIDSVSVENQYAGDSSASIPAGEVTQGEKVNLTAKVTNEGSGPGTDEVTVEFGSNVSQTVSVEGLSGDASTDVYVTVRVGTVSTGQYTLSANVAGSSQSQQVNVVRLGDVDHSGSVGPGDATTTQRAIINLNVGTYNPAAADTTLDGSIGPGDVTRIQQTIVQLFEPETDLDLSTEVRASGTK
jgi:hypothetical protein